MKNRNQVYTIFASAIVSLSVHSIGQAQVVVSQPEQAIAPSVQNEYFEAPVILFPNPPRASSWQGQELALQGRDVVSYFQASAPLEGSEKYTADWDDTTWHFSSEENRDLFAENPGRYVPAFGGYCPVALARNDAKVGFSKHYTVVDEKLYLNYNQKTYDQFVETPEEYIVRAQLNF